MTTTTTSIYDPEVYMSYTICPFCLEKNWIGYMEFVCAHVETQDYIGKDKAINVNVWEVEYND